jgi:branched-chain amino acid transport system substrate-binding protein
MRWLCGISLLMVLAGCGGQSAPAPINVGHVVTLTGPGKEEGEQEVHGIRLAVQEQNKSAAEDNSRPVLVRHTDTKGQLAAFEAEAVRLVTVNRVLAILGGTTTEEIMRLDRAGVPIISRYGVRQRGQSDLVFLTGLTPVFQGKVLARFAAEKLGPVQVVILVDERREESLALAEAFARQFPISAEKTKKTTPPRPLTWRYGQEEDSFPQLAKRLGVEKPGAILLAGTISDLGKFRKQFPPPAPILFGGDSPGRSLLDSPDSDGIYLTTAFVLDLDVPLAKEFVANYRKAFNEDPDESAALAYDGARLLFEAIRKSGALPGGEKIAKELAELKDFPGLTGPMSFTADRHLPRPAFLARVQKGRLQTIKRFRSED